MDLAPVGTDTSYGAVRRSEYLGDGRAGQQPCSCRARQPYEVCGGQCGHHLGVLRVVDAARHSGGEFGFEGVELVGRDGARVNTGVALLHGELLQCRQAFGGRRHDDAALGLELDGLGHSRLGGEFGPQPQGEQGEFELGAGLLVGDEQVPLARAGGASGHGAPVHQGDGIPRPRRIEGTSSAYHSGADHYNIAGQPRSHGSTMSHVPKCAKGH